MIFCFSILLRSTLFDIVSLNLRRPVPIKNPLIGMKKNSLLVSLAWRQLKIKLEDVRFFCIFS